MLQLYLAPKQSKESGMVKLNWCIPRKVGASLKEREAWLLVVVQPEGKPNHLRHQRRQLVPLNDGATFVSFRYAGPNTVFARVLTGSYDSLKDYLTCDLAFISSDGFGWTHTLADVQKRLSEVRAGIEEIDAKLAIVESGTEEGVRSARSVRGEFPATARSSPTPRTTARSRSGTSAPTARGSSAR